MAPSTLLTTAALAVVLAIGATMWRSQMLEAHTDALRSRDEARAAVDSAQAAMLNEPIAEAPDFATRLPEHVAADAVVRDLQRAGVAAGVALASFHATERPTSVAALGRLELRVVLRGAYPGVKSVLAEVAARHSSLLVQRVSMRQAAGPADLDAQVEIVLLSRPVLRTAAPGS